MYILIKFLLLEYRLLFFEEGKFLIMVDEVWGLEVDDLCLLLLLL